MDYTDTTIPGSSQQPNQYINKTDTINKLPDGQHEYKQDTPPKTIGEKAKHIFKTVKNKCGAGVRKVQGYIKAKILKRRMKQHTNKIPDNPETKLEPDYPETKLDASKLTDANNEHFKYENKQESPPPPEIIGDKVKRFFKVLKDKSEAGMKKVRAYVKAKMLARRMNQSVSELPITPETKLDASDLTSSKDKQHVYENKQDSPSEAVDKTKLSETKLDETKLTEKKINEVTFDKNDLIDKKINEVTFDENKLTVTINEIKSADTKLDETKLDETNVDDIKLDETKVDDIKLDETKVDENKLQKNKLDESKLDETKVNETKLDETKVDDIKVDETKVNEMKLDGTKVDETKVDGTKVDETKVDGTKVDATKLDETKVDETKVDEIKVDATKLDETKVDETKVDETKVDETKVDETKVDETKVDATKLDETKVDATKLGETKVKEIKLDGTKLDDIKLEETKLEETKLDETKVDDIKFADVKLDDTKVNEMKLDGTKLDETKLGETKVKEIKLDGTKLDDIKLEETKLDETKVDDIKLADVKLDDTKVNEMKLDGTKLDETKLDDTKVNEMKLDGTKLEDTKVDESKLDDTKVDETKLTDTKDTLAEAKVNEIKKPEVQKNKNILREEIRSTNFIEVNEWFKEEYTRQVGVPHKEMSSGEKLLKKALAALKRQRFQLLGERFSYARPIRNGPKVYDVSWGKAQLALKCTCPTGNCSCAYKRTIMLRPTGVPSVFLVSSFPTNLIRRIPFVPFYKPSGLIKKKLEEEVDEEFKAYSTPAMWNKIKQRGPEFCMSGCLQNIMSGRSMKIEGLNPAPMAAVPILAPAAEKTKKGKKGKEKKKKKIEDDDEDEDDADEKDEKKLEEVEEVTEAEDTDTYDDYDDVDDEMDSEDEEEMEHEAIKICNLFFCSEPTQTEVNDDGEIIYGDEARVLYASPGQGVFKDISGTKIDMFSYQKLRTPEAPELSPLTYGGVRQRMSKMSSKLTSIFEMQDEPVLNKCGQGDGEENQYKGPIGKLYRLKESILALFKDSNPSNVDLRKSELKFYKRCNTSSVDITRKVSYKVDSSQQHDAATNISSTNKETKKALEVMFDDMVHSNVPESGTDNSNVKSVMSIVGISNKPSKSFEEKSNKIKREINETNDEPHIYDQNNTLDSAVDNKNKLMLTEQSNYKHKYTNIRSSNLSLKSNNTRVKIPTMTHAGANENDNNFNNKTKPQLDKLKILSPKKSVYTGNMKSSNGVGADNSKPSQLSLNKEKHERKPEHIKPNSSISRRSQLSANKTSCELKASIIKNISALCDNVNTSNTLLACEIESNNILNKEPKDGEINLESKQLVSSIDKERREQNPANIDNVKPFDIESHNSKILKSTNNEKCEKKDDVNEKNKQGPYTVQQIHVELNKCSRPLSSLNIETLEQKCDKNETVTNKINYKPHVNDLNDTLPMTSAVDDKTKLMSTSQSKLKYKDTNITASNVTLNPNYISVDKSSLTRNDTESKLNEMNYKTDDVEIKPQLDNCKKKTKKSAKIKNLESLVRVEFDGPSQSSMGRGNLNLETKNVKPFDVESETSKRSQLSVKNMICEMKTSIIKNISPLCISKNTSKTCGLKLDESNNTLNKKNLLYDVTKLKSKQSSLYKERCEEKTDNNENVKYISTTLNSTINDMTCEKKDIISENISPLSVEINEYKSSKSCELKTNSISKKMSESIKSNTSKTSQSSAIKGKSENAKNQKPNTYKLSQSSICKSDDKGKREPVNKTPVIASKENYVDEDISIPKLENEIDRQKNLSIIDETIHSVFDVDGPNSSTNVESQSQILRQSSQENEKIGTSRTLQKTDTYEIVKTDNGPIKCRNSKKYDAKNEVERTKTKKSSHDKDIGSSAEKKKSNNIESNDPDEGVVQKGAEQKFEEDQKRDGNMNKHRFYY